MGDRIPVDFWATGAVIGRLEQDLGIPYTEFLDRYDVDLRYIAGPAYAGPTLGPGEDIWGVRRAGVAAGADEGSEVYEEVAEAPLANAQSIEAIHNYDHWPDPDWFDYSGIEAQCDEVLEQERVVVFMGDRLNRVAQLKPAMYLRGTQEIFTDLALRPEMAQAVFDNIRRFYLAYLKRILEAAKGKIDIVLTGDDFGAQNGLLLSREMWLAVLREGFAEYLSLIRAHGATSMHHTCGSVVDLLPDMIGSGLDVLQSLQPEARGMALPDLLRDYGDRICFQGGVSIQNTMPHGTPADIRGEVKAIADAVKPRAGYIFCTSHNIQADTPTANVVALMEAYLELGGV
jgi:uroporphyrinogen decarboxylase